MEMFIVASVVTALLVMAGVLIVRNVKYKALATRNRWCAAIVSIILSVVMVCDLMAGKDVLSRLLFDILLTTVCLSLLTSSIIAGQARKVIFLLTVICDSLLMVYYLLCAAGILNCPELHQIRQAVCLLIISYLGVFLFFIWYKIRDIHALMQSASVWSWLTFSVDVVLAHILCRCVLSYSIASPYIDVSAVFQYSYSHACFMYAYDRTDVVVP